MKIRFALVTLLCAAASAAHADALDTLRDFVREVKTGKSQFTQTVTSPDGAKKRTSSGNFEFARPNRFRFAYTKPFEQTIVADGQKVWIYDRDLNQVTVKKLGDALASTPAALLAGRNELERNFDLKEGGTEDGVAWVDARPKVAEGGFESVRIGFAEGVLRGMVLRDSFGQTTLLRFTQFERNPALDAAQFRFTPPAGADVIGDDVKK